MLANALAGEVAVDQRVDRHRYLEDQRVGVREAIASEPVVAVDVILIEPRVAHEEAARLELAALLRQVLIEPVALADQAREPDARLPVLDLLVVVARGELFNLEAQLVGCVLDHILQYIRVVYIVYIEVLHKSWGNIHALVEVLCPGQQADVSSIAKSFVSGVFEGLNDVFVAIEFDIADHGEVGEGLGDVEGAHGALDDPQFEAPHVVAEDELGEDVHLQFLVERVEVEVP